MSVQVHYRACHLCEALCGLEITYQGDDILSIKGDKNDPLSRGHICPKAVSLKELHEDPDRLKHPVRRTESGWEQISWEEAFDEVAAQIMRVQAEHGRDAIGVYLGNPTAHNYGAILMGPQLLRHLRTKNQFSATSLDQLPHMLMASIMFGHQMLMPIPDVDHTDCFVIMGGNPLASNGSIMTAPDIRKRLQAISARGGKVIVIDPRRTETAKIADQHIFIKPGTDALLLLAVLHVLKREGLADPGRLGDFLDGLETFWEHVEGVTPAIAAAHTGVSAEDIVELALTFGRTKRAAWYGRLGVSTQRFGTICQWLLYAINIVTGKLDQRGGMMFTTPLFDTIAQKLSGRGRFGRWKSRVRGLPEFGGELPSAVMAEEILTPGEGQIKAMITHAGNPVLSSPNGKQLDEALASLDFMVSIDIYINETTRHANIILPPTVGLEHENYDVIFHMLAIRNTARFSPALFEPAPDARHDWEIFLSLLERLEATEGPHQLKVKARHASLRKMGAEGLLDMAMRYSSGSKGLFWLDGWSVKRLKKMPHGVDLGPLQPVFPARLQNREKEIKLAPEMLLEDLKRLRGHFGLDGATGAGSSAETPTETTASTETPAEAPFLLIGRRQLRSNNSWMHNCPQLMRGKDRCTLLMHPEDGASLSIEDGQEVEVRSGVGALTCSVVLSDEMMQGVVSLPHGWGHSREGVELEVASQTPGVSLNDLTDELLVDELTGNAAFNGVPVWVDVR